ncbi:hypothetical protein JCM10212_002369 [Sporobolomyces blumeae]
MTTPFDLHELTDQALVDRLCTPVEEDDVEFVVFWCRALAKRSVRKRVLLPHSWKYGSALAVAIARPPSACRVLILQILLHCAQYDMGTPDWSRAMGAQTPWAVKVLEAWRNNGGFDRTDATRLVDMRTKDAARWIEQHVPPPPALDSLTRFGPLPRCPFLPSSPTSCDSTLYRSSRPGAPRTDVANPCGNVETRPNPAEPIRPIKHLPVLSDAPSASDRCSPSRECTEPQIGPASQASMVPFDDLPAVSVSTERVKVEDVASGRSHDSPTSQACPVDPERERCPTVSSRISTPPEPASKRCKLETRSRAADHSADPLSSWRSSESPNEFRTTAMTPSEDEDDWPSQCERWWFSSIFEAPHQGATVQTLIPAPRRVGRSDP